MAEIKADSLVTTKELYIGDPRQRRGVNAKQLTNPEVGYTFHQTFFYYSKLLYTPRFGVTG